MNSDKGPSTEIRAASVAIPRAPEWSQMLRIWPSGPQLAFLLIWKASDQVFDPRYSHCLKSDDRPSIEIHSSEYGISRITKLAFFEQIQRWPYTVIFMFCPRTRTVLFSSVRYLFLGSMPFLDVIRRFPVSGSLKMLLIRRSKFWSL